MIAMKFTAASLALMPLAACAAATPPPFDEDDNPRARPEAELCNAEAAQVMLGEMANEATGARLLELSGARTLRWVPPRSAITMDYRADRLTVSYNDDYIIERINCG